MQIRHLLWPEIEDLARPRGDVAHNSEIVNEGVEVWTARLEICWVGQFAKVGVLGVF